MVRDKALTREKLIAATRDKLLADGLESINVDNVCKLAGFTRGAFYSNFKKIDELILLMVEQELSHYINRFQAMTNQWVAAVDKLTPDFEEKDPVAQLATLLLNTKVAGGLDRSFFVLYYEVETKSLRVPEWAEMIVPLLLQFVESVADILVAMLEHVGRRPTVRKQLLGQAVIGLVARSKGLNTWNSYITELVQQHPELADAVLTDEEISHINATLMIAFSEPNN
ncbi:MAG: hypothetical protein SPI77_02230 [Corynebacterium sp.]|nr:hypothetical protein [Corynebacterium sp.]